MGVREEARVGQGGQERQILFSYRIGKTYATSVGKSGEGILRLYEGILQKGHIQACILSPLRFGNTNMSKPSTSFVDCVSETVPIPRRSMDTFPTLTGGNTRSVERRGRCALRQTGPNHCPERCIKAGRGILPQDSEVEGMIGGG